MLETIEIPKKEQSPVGADMGGIALEHSVISTVKPQPWGRVRKALATSLSSLEIGQPLNASPGNAVRDVKGAGSLAHDILSGAEVPPPQTHQPVPERVLPLVRKV